MIKNVFRGASNSIWHYSICFYPWSRNKYENAAGKKIYIFFRWQMKRVKNNSEGQVYTREVYHGAA